MSFRLSLDENILGNIAPDGYGDGYTRDVSLAQAYSIQMVSSGASSPVGVTITVSASNEVTPTNWVAGTPLAVSTNTSAFLTVPTYCKWIKLTKALSSGSIDIKCWLVTREDIT